MRNVTPERPTFDEFVRVGYYTGSLIALASSALIVLGVVFWPMSGGLIDPAEAFRFLGMLGLSFGLLITGSAFGVRWLTEMYTVEFRRIETATDGGEETDE